MEPFMPSPLPRWIKSRWYLLTSRSRPFLVVVAFWMLVTGCAANPKITVMNAWIGRTGVELRQAMGEPMRVEPVPIEGHKKLIYETGYNVVTGGKCSTDSLAPDGGYFPCWPDTKSFYLDSMDQVVAWDWWGCWGSHRSVDKPNESKAGEIVGKVLVTLLLIALVVGIIILLSKADEPERDIGAGALDVFLTPPPPSPPSPRPIFECSFDTAPWPRFPPKKIESAESVPVTS
ncbi:MAG: hypothetical protein AB1405_09680 [Bdellovibrionota bacterium]